jgi:hypothetical protein
MRAESEGDGNLGILMLVLLRLTELELNGLDFKDITNMTKIVYKVQAGLSQHKKVIFISLREYLWNVLTD